LQQKERKRRSRRGQPQPAKQKRRVIKVSASDAAARDEGPRLIPLPPKNPEHHPDLQHYLELADAALRSKKSPPKPRK
jgi:hypothetical protein